MPQSPRSELLAIQKKLYRRNKDLIENSILVKEPGFEGYEGAYRRAVAGYERIATQEEMVETVLSADIIYVGDYHTCNQSQRSFLRILKAVIAEDPNFMIGLELIHKRHQKIIDRYLSGRLSQETFLGKIGLKEHWVFDLWENFKPLFDFSCYHGLPVFGIDAAPEGATIRDRDRASAALIAKVIDKNPGRRIFIFIGDLHIAPSHLPKDVTESLKRKGIGVISKSVRPELVEGRATGKTRDSLFMVRQAHHERRVLKHERRELILFENSEAIYWKLADEGLDDQVEVVLLSDGNFCRMHTPPIICQQSYLNWLEHEEGEIDYADAKASFLELVHGIAAFLRIRLGREKDNVEVFTCGDLSFLKRLRESGKFSRKEIEMIKMQILSSESYYIAKTRFVYLANLSMNHAAEEASHFIKHLCSGEEEPRELVDAFYANILHESLGFFGSKLINHKRKCYHEKDFKELLTFFTTIHVPTDRRIEQETALLVVEYKAYERKGRPLKYTAIFKQKLDLFLAVTHALGYMMGDRLYYGMMQGVISRKAIRKLYFDEWKKPGEPFKAYMELVRILRHVKIPKRM